MNSKEYLENLRNLLIRRAEYGDADDDAYHPEAETMIGEARMRNLQGLCTRVIREGIPGDFIECGVWRGGACILMRGVLKALGDESRKVWVADSFEGLPKPEWPPDTGDEHWKKAELAVSQADVEGNFRKYDLLDDRVQFLKGWFKDTLYSAPITSLAILRLDGDMYGSTIEALVELYARVSVGGYVIVDDYGAMLACRQAVDDFRRINRIMDQIVNIDQTGVYWRRGTT